MTTKPEIRFYLDENVENQIAKGLRTRSIDALTTGEADHMGWKDEQHLAFARSEQCVIVTQDTDFLKLHAQGQPHAGIAYYKAQMRTPKQILRGLLLIYELLQPEDMKNHIEYL
jgi:predicted nuclease of predicted toxin-antitoxin system